ncbi:dyggve-melchior-clausen syndrome protein [Cystoisospora suis]|uniref:Dymeclin n=1 Tax=Cystoisospora suis TaxID=483139 RepID=A0A2C6L3T6_9APIC|nr:dyggve-melchior-clausen syndrome protein [Cystoisospora suis]
MGSGSSRSSSSGGTDRLCLGDLDKPTVSLIHAVRQLASSSSSPPVSLPLKSSETCQGKSGEKQIRSYCIDASSSSPACLEDTDAGGGGWDSILLSLAESSALPSSLSSDFLWRELLVPLLVGNPTNGQLRALFVFFAKTLHRYAEAVEATHHHLISLSQGRNTCSSSTTTTSKKLSQSTHFPHPTVVSVTVKGKRQQEQASSLTAPILSPPPFPCSDASLSELALLLRILTKTLCSRLSFPQLLYHLEYTPSDFSWETNAHIASLLYILSSSSSSSSFFTPRSPRSSQPSSSSHHSCFQDVSHHDHEPADNLHTSTRESYRESPRKMEAHLPSVLPSTSPNAAVIRQQVNESASSTSPGSREDETIETLGKEKNPRDNEITQPSSCGKNPRTEGRGEIGYTDSHDSTPSETPVTCKVGLLSCESHHNATNTTTPTTTATLEGSFPSNESQKISLSLDPMNIQKGAETSLTISPLTRENQREEAIHIGPTTPTTTATHHHIRTTSPPPPLCVFLLSYRGAYKVVPISRLPSPIVLHREILSWLYEVYPEDACAASSRGFVFRGLARFDSDAPSTEVEQEKNSSSSLDTKECSYTREEEKHHEDIHKQQMKKKKRKEIFLSLNDIASSTLMSTVFEPLTLDRKAVQEQASFLVKRVEEKHHLLHQGEKETAAAQSESTQEGEDNDVTNSCRRQEEEGEEEEGPGTSRRHSQMKNAYKQEIGDESGDVPKRTYDQATQAKDRSRDREEVPNGSLSGEGKDKKGENSEGDHHENVTHQSPTVIISNEEEKRRRDQEEEEIKRISNPTSTTILLAELTIVPLWVPISSSSSSSSCSSSSVIGSLTDALIKFVTTTQPPSPCCSPLILRTHQHLLELLLSLSAVISPIQLTASCLPRPLPLGKSRHQLAQLLTSRDPTSCHPLSSQLRHIQQHRDAERPLEKDERADYDQFPIAAAELGKRRGAGMREDGHRGNPSFEGENEAFSSFSKSEKTLPQTHKGESRMLERREALLVPPLSSPCCKCAPSFYAWQQQAQQLRVTRSLEADQKILLNQRQRSSPVDHKAGPKGDIGDRRHVQQTEGFSTSTQVFPPVAAGALLPDLSLLEIFLSRCEGSERAELQAKEFAAYLLNLVWPSSALLLPSSPSSSPSFVNIPPALAHCALSIFLLFTFYPHPSTRAALTGCSRLRKPIALKKKRNLLKIPPHSGDLLHLSEMNSQQGGRVFGVGNPPTTVAGVKGGGDKEDDKTFEKNLCTGQNMTMRKRDDSSEKKKNTGGSSSSYRPVDREEERGEGKQREKERGTEGLHTSNKGDSIEERRRDVIYNTLSCSSVHSRKSDSSSRPMLTPRLSSQREEGGIVSTSPSSLSPGPASNDLSSSSSLRAFSSSLGISPAIAQRSMKMKMTHLPPLHRRTSSVEANAFSLAFSSLYDSSHFSLKKSCRPFGEDEEDEGGMRPLTFPPSSSLNFEGLLVQLCSPQSLAHPLKPLLLYLLLCRNRCFRLFYLSRSDGERLVLPLLQILNTLSRVLQSPATIPSSSTAGAIPAKAEGTRLHRSIPPQTTSSPSPVSGVAPPIAAICGVCLLTLSKDKSFCSELFKKVVKEVPWLEQGRSQVVNNMSLGSVLVLVLLRLLSWNLRRCGDVFFLLLCSSVFLNISTSVEQLHWYVADRLVDYTAALLRQLQRHLSANDFAKASRRLSLSSLLPYENQERRRLGGDYEQRQRRSDDSYNRSSNSHREREDEILKGESASFSQQSTHQKAPPRQHFHKNGGEGKTDFQEREACEFLETGHESSPQHSQQIEGLLVVFRALLTFIVTALRPPFHQKNLSLLFAVLRLFPLDISRSLISQFQAAWLYTQAVQGEGRQLPSSSFSRENVTDLSHLREGRNEPYERKAKETNADFDVKRTVQNSQDLEGEEREKKEDVDLLQREEREEEERKNEKRGEDSHVSVSTAEQGRYTSRDEKERKEEDGERRRKRDNEEDLVIRSTAETLTHVGLLIGGELKLVVDLVTFFTNAIDDAVRDGSILEEDVEGSKRIVEHWAAKIPPPTRPPDLAGVGMHASSSLFSSYTSSARERLGRTADLDSGEDEKVEDLLTRRKRQMDRLRESFLACSVPGRVDFVESLETACYFVPLVWRTIDLLTPDSVCWDRAPPFPTPLVFSPLQSTTG